MRKTITIPAAGEKQPFSITGRSIMIEQVPVYNNATDVPLMHMAPGGSEYPIYPRSTYPNDNGQFQQLELIGTAESAGDEITLVSTDECLALNINILFNETSKSVAGNTQTKNASDSPQGFSAVEVADADGNMPKRLYIYVIGGTTRGINYAYGSNPSQGDNAANCYYWDNERDHEAAGDLITIEPLEIIGIDWILNFNFVATVPGETPTVIWTPEY